MVTILENEKNEMSESNVIGEKGNSWNINSTVHRQLTQLRHLHARKKIIKQDESEVIHIRVTSNNKWQCASWKELIIFAPLNEPFGCCYRLLHWSCWWRLSNHRLSVWKGMSIVSSCISLSLYCIEFVFFTYCLLLTDPNKCLMKNSETFPLVLLRVRALSLSPSYCFFPEFCMSNLCEWTSFKYDSQESFKLHQCLLGKQN